MSAIKKSVEEIKDGDINNMIMQMESFSKYITSILRNYKEHLDKLDSLNLPHNKPDSNITDLKYHKFILTDENKQILKTLIITILENYINLTTPEKNRHNRNIDIISALQLALISLQYKINIFTTIATCEVDSFEMVSTDKIAMHADAVIIEHIQSLYQSYILQVINGLTIKDIEYSLFLEKDNETNNMSLFNTHLVPLYNGLNLRKKAIIHTGIEKVETGESNNSKCSIMNKYIKYKSKYIKLKQLLGK